MPLLHPSQVTSGWIARAPGAFRNILKTFFLRKISKSDALKMVMLSPSKSENG